MLKADLTEILRDGESSGVEFQRGDVHPDRLAQELVALANFEGGPRAGAHRAGARARVRQFPVAEVA